MTSPSLQSDEQLAASALQGDQEAFTALYQNYFDQVYDLASRVLKDSAAAADVAQNVFMKFLGGAEVKPPQVSFRAWLYTMTRNAAIDELRRRRRVLPLAATEMGEAVFNQVSTSSQDDPERVTLANELASLVWEAAQSLNPSEYTLLDLNIRKGLEPEELAQALGTTRGNVYTRLSRLRDTLEEAVTTLILARRGRDDCPELNNLLAGFAPGESLTPRARRAVSRHIRTCRTCEDNRRRHLSATALFGGLAAVLPAAAVKSEIWGGLVAASGGGPPPPPPQPPATSSTVAPEFVKNSVHLWTSLGTGVQAMLVGLALLGVVGVGVMASVLALRSSPGPFPTITEFRLVDPAVGDGGIARNRELLVEIVVDHESENDLTAIQWFIQERSTPQPSPEEANWASSPPETYILSAGDGDKSVGLWLKDAKDNVTLAAQSVVLLDATVPLDPANAFSTTHQIGVPSSKNLVTVQWSTAVDPEPSSGIAGYSIDWDQSPNTVPGPVLDLDASFTETTSPPLDEGSWYLHLSTIDLAGNYTATVHVGPFIIETFFVRAPESGASNDPGGAPGVGPGPDEVPQSLEEDPSEVTLPETPEAAVPQAPSGSGAGNQSSDAGNGPGTNGATTNVGGGGSQTPPGSGGGPDSGGAGETPDGDGPDSSGQGPGNDSGDGGGGAGGTTGDSGSGAPGDGSGNNGGSTGGGGGSDDDDDDGSGATFPPPTTPPGPQFRPSLTVAVTGTSVASVGDPVLYGYIITNNSSSDTPPLILDDLVDSLLGNLTGQAIEEGCGTLLTGDSCDFEVAREVQSGDPDPLINTATATYHLQSSAKTVSGSAIRSVDLEESVEVTVSGPGSARVGEVIQYRYQVTNTSFDKAADLALVSIVDDLLGNLKEVAVESGCAVLPSGESCGFQVDREIQSEDPDPLVNRVEVRYGHEGAATEVTAADSHSVDLEESVEVTVSGPDSARVGEVIQYRYQVTNTSFDKAADLALVSIVDDVLENLTEVAVESGCAVLPSGGSCGFQADREIQSEDPDPLVNRVEVRYQPDGAAEAVTASDSHSVEVLGTNEDGIPGDVDCNPDFADDHIVDPAGIVAASFSGSVHATLQAAVNAASDNQVISLYADTRENVVIGNSAKTGGRDLLIFGCGHTITAADVELPVVHIEASAGADDGDTGAGSRDVHIEDLRVKGGATGFLIETGNSSAGVSTLLLSVHAYFNRVGVQILGSNNEVRGASIVGNGDIGLWVVGGNNLIGGNHLEDNGATAIEVAVHESVANDFEDGEIEEGNSAGTVAVVAHGNRIEGNNIIANAGAGINVRGYGNSISHNDVGGNNNKGNGGAGIIVTGDYSEIEDNIILGNGGPGISIDGENGAIKRNRVGGNGNRGNAGDGIRVAGAGAAVEENKIFDNDGRGIGVTGNNTAITKNLVGDNGDRGNAGDGIWVNGSGATIQGNRVFNNGGSGVVVTGDKATVKRNQVGDINDRGNSGDGINVAGGDSVIIENTVFSNRGDGIEVSSGSAESPNRVRKNQVGGKSAKGNHGNGILVSGDGNGDASPVDIEENVVQASGLAGIKVVGTAHGLRQNDSGSPGEEDNEGCDYDLAGGNLDLGENQSDGAIVSLIIPGCTGGPTEGELIGPLVLAITQRPWPLTGAHRVRRI